MSVPDMKECVFLVLFGLPAAGKYTVARRLVESLNNLSLYHNHDMVDRVLARHPFGSEGFCREREDGWRVELEEELVEALRRSRFVGSNDDRTTNGDGPSSGVVFTFNPESSVRQELVDWFFNALATSAFKRYVAAEGNVETRRVKEDEVVGEEEERRTSAPVNDEGVDEDPKRHLVTSPPLVLSIELLAEERDIEARMESESRRAFKKLQDVELYRHLRDTGVFATPRMPAADLTVDTSRHSVEETVKIIVNFVIEQTRLRT